MWKELAGKHTKCEYVVYAHEKSAMYQDMAKDCRERFKTVGDTWSNPWTSLADHILKAQ